MNKEKNLVTRHRNLKATQTGCKTRESQPECAFSTKTLSRQYKHPDRYTEILTPGQQQTLLELRKLSQRHGESHPYLSFFSDF